MIKQFISTLIDWALSFFGMTSPLVLAAAAAAGIGLAISYRLSASPRLSPFVVLPAIMGLIILWPVVGTLIGVITETLVPEWWGQARRYSAFDWFWPWQVFEAVTVFLPVALASAGFGYALLRIRSAMLVLPLALLASVILSGYLVVSSIFVACHGWASCI